ncbi:MAG: undecaprenyl/decaprenyl-phosphate alpha-N-acetylglucosaminyl 1-phosphate transferase [Clostridiales Family XIII bacterium]|jgi:UDP-GlcNAc:undecaprenyl-phosphate GlcNAc-1-phosphate transferase|nr:undecaprenyl/decaprenyl-phosphate alpha-N-acetylglucosaminyl 1-phosphate transferase [Clostridiales Family XIII bacterium]
MNEITELRLVTLGCIVIPAAITLALTPLSMRVAGHIGAIDVPKDGRRMHDRPVPCFGGMSIFVGVIAALLYIENGFFSGGPLLGRYGVISGGEISGLIAGGAIIFVVGVIDDVRGMRPVPKLLMQIVGAAAAFAFGVRIDAIKLFGVNFLGDTATGVAVSFIITVIWIVAIINMINLIDGMDGLAAGVTGISSLAIAYASYIWGYYDIAFGMCAIAGAAFGFLPFNFYPAKSFMGDGGAMFLGFMLASVAIGGDTSQAKGTTIIAIIVPALVLGVPLFDVLFAVFRRAARRQPIFKADKGHLHHQLTNIGMGQRRTVVMLYGITSVMGVAAILLSRKLILESIFLFCVAVLFIIVLIWKWNVKGK